MSAPIAQSSSIGSILRNTECVPPDLKEHIAQACAEYQRSHSLEDFDKLLELWRIVRALAESMAVAVGALGRIFLGLTERGKLAGDAAHLDELIDTLRQLIDLHPDSPYLPDIRTSLSTEYVRHLAIALAKRYELRKNVEDLDASISAWRQACALAPEYGVYMQGLVVTLYTRFDAMGQKRDADEADNLTRRVLEFEPDALAHRTDFIDRQQFSSLARAFRSRDLDALDTSLALGRIQAADRDDERESVLMHATSLEARFGRYGEISDLDLAISLYTSLIGSGLGDISILHLLGRCYAYRYIATKQARRSDIDEAISLLLKAIELCSQSEKPPVVFSLERFRLDLSYSYMMRFDYGDSYQDMADIDNALRLLLDLKESGDPDADDPAWHLHYARCLTIRCKVLDEAAASAARHEAISVLEEALARFSEHNGDRRLMPATLREIAQARRNLLANDLGGRLPYPVFLSRMQEVLQAFVDTAKAQEEPDHELQAVHGFSIVYAAYCLHPIVPLEDAKAFFDVNVVKDMFSRFLNRMPDMIWLGHTLSRRYEELPKLQFAIATAVATVCRLEDTGAALEWFEQGRAVVWSQIQDLRTPLHELRKKHPDLADELENLSAGLEQAGRRAPLPSLDPSSILARGHADPVEELAVSGRRLARQHQLLLKRIRSLDGFQSFLLPKRAETLVSAALDGRAVACINVHDQRCDVLVILGSRIHHVPLPQLTSQKVGDWHVRLTRFLQRERARAAVVESRKGHVVNLAQRADDLQTDPIREVLREMWVCVVWPTLEVYLDNLEGDRAHITWCTTGQLSFLPLHAAGPYEGDSLNAFDMVVSSYTPNLSSLKPPAFVEEPVISPSILVVAQPDAPNVERLPGTVVEVGKIQKRFDGTDSDFLIGAQGTAPEVLKLMAKHPYVHLACHGKQDADPTKSAFILHPGLPDGKTLVPDAETLVPDGKASLPDGALTLHSLMAHKSSNAQLAFLSACETATGDEKVPNEAVHLAAGMLAAGYKSVVATMWSIGDTEAPRVADEFYKALLADPERNVAFALHTAVQKLREHVGVDQFVKWMPFIHLGV